MLFRLFIFWGFLFSSFVSFAQTDEELQESIQRGAKIYQNICIICHKDDGQGMPFSYPPLANSDFLLKNTDDAIRAVKYGLQGEIKVNGITYLNEMPDQGLANQEVMDVMNYILNTWGNQGNFITLEKVQQIEKEP